MTRQKNLPGYVGDYDLTVVEWQRVVCKWIEKEYACASRKSAYER